MKIRDRIVELRRVRAGDLIPNPRNWRRHPKAQADALRGVLAEIGYASALLARETPGGLQLIDGHLRAETTPDMEVPVLVLDVTEAEADKILLTHDPLAAMAEADDEALTALLRDVGTESDAVREMLDGLAKEEGIELDPEPAEDPGAQLDVADELREKWGVERGQLWTIGQHRILCGDSTSADDVARLMAGERAVLMSTDPPYGVAYDNAERPNPGVAKPRVAKPRVANDDLVDGPRMQAFLEGMLRAAASSMWDRAAYYFWHPMLTQGTYVAAAAAAGILIHRQIIWVKPVLLLGRGDYHWKHELCFYGWRQGHRTPFLGTRDQTTVWEVSSVSGREREAYGHATPKPIELFRRPIENHTKYGEVVYEPFAGSGPQFVAAEQLSRRCYGIEIEPKYVAVVLQRLADMGLRPELSV